MLLSVASDICLSRLAKNFWANMGILRHFGCQCTQKELVVCQSEVVSLTCQHIDTPAWVRFMVTTPFVIIGMYTDFMKNLCRGVQHLFIDATFKPLPPGFSQLLILLVYSEFAQASFPVAFVLMSTKSQAAYSCAFQFLATALDLHPTHVTCDFELGLINAVRCA